VVAVVELVDGAVALVVAVVDGTEVVVEPALELAPEQALSPLPSTTARISAAPAGLDRWCEARPGVFTR
jgi:hypothetical protein